MNFLKWFRGNPSTGKPAEYLDNIPPADAVEKAKEWLEEARKSPACFRSPQTIYYLFYQQCQALQALSQNGVSACVCQQGKICQSCLDASAPSKPAKVRFTLLETYWWVDNRHDIIRKLERIGFTMVSADDANTGISGPAMKPASATIERDIPSMDALHHLASEVRPLSLIVGTACGEFLVEWSGD